MSNPGKAHCNVMKWLLRYIAETLDYGLQYMKLGEKVSIERYINLDYAGDRDSRMSTSSYYFLECGN